MATGGNMAARSAAASASPSRAPCDFWKTWRQSQSRLRHVSVEADENAGETWRQSRRWPRHRHRARHVIFGKHGGKVRAGFSGGAVSKHATQGKHGGKARAGFGEPLKTIWLSRPIAETSTPRNSATTLSDNKNESACKPGSVENDYSSGMHVAMHL